MGQYLCNTTSNIDPATQQPRGCTPENIAKSKLLCYLSLHIAYSSCELSGISNFANHEIVHFIVTCTAVDGLRCEETGNRTFEKYIPCKWT